jgi:hypothetical protein
MIVLGAVMSAQTNSAPIRYGPTVLPGMRLYDGMSLALSGVMVVLPLLLGRKFFAHPENQALLLRALVVGGLVLSPLIVFEIRMSPQLNLMVYGFRANSWVQSVRGGGFRPSVFMTHGLQLAIFVAAVSLAAFGASRALDSARRRFYLLAGGWMLAVLFLSNSLGAFLIAIVFLPVMLFLNPRLQLLFAGVVAASIVFFPMLRSVDLVPTDRILEMVERIDARRVGSLAYRFRNEDILLDHAMEKPLFGWGSWGRNRVFDETGKDTVTTDGYWVIIMGSRGWVGYLATFGLLAGPILLLALYRRRYATSPVTVVLALVVTASLVDLIPNAFLSPVTVLIVGALWGRWELGAAVEETRPAADAEVPVGQFAYTRPRAGLGPRDVSSPDLASSNGQRDRAPYTRQTTRHTRSEPSGKRGVR